MDGNLAYEYADRPDLAQWRQLIDGKVVLVVPCSEDHVSVSGNIFNIFYSYLRGKPGRVYMEGPYVYLTERDYYIPDVCVLCDRSKIRNGRLYGAPDLVVEVLSRSSSRYDRGRKKEIYEQSGVKEYWLVNPRDRTVEQYLLSDGALRLRDVYALFRDGEQDPVFPEEMKTSFHCSLFPELEISLDDVFYDMIE